MSKSQPGILSLQWRTTAQTTHFNLKGGTLCPQVAVFRPTLLHIIIITGKKACSYCSNLPCPSSLNKTLKKLKVYSFKCSVFCTILYRKPQCFCGWRFFFFSSVCDKHLLILLFTPSVFFQGNRFVKLRLVSQKRTRRQCISNNRCSL